MRPLFVCLITFAAAALPRPAAAQIYEAVGVRAQGMGGAFVGLADDATATWWNPAGLASGAYFNALVEVGSEEEPAAGQTSPGVASSSWRTTARGFTIALPSLGLSYYRLRVSQIVSPGPTGPGTGDRQDQGRAPVRLSSLLLQQFGATVGQSLGDHFTIGSTLILMRGSFAASEVPGGEASLGGADALDGNASTRGDLDLGVMATFGSLRAGVAMKHVTKPSFDSGSDRIDLGRQVRAGVSVTAPGGPAIGPLTLGADVDLTRTATADGDIRHVAAGAETWLLGRRLGLRGGVTASTVGDARVTGSGGASVALRSGLYLDGQLTRGGDSAAKGWGIAARVTF